MISNPAQLSQHKKTRIELIKSTVRTMSQLRQAVTSAVKSIVGAR
jgi:hypothetical protein